MASRRPTRRRRTLRPRTPSRVRKRTKKTRSHQHPELWGLGMTAVGLFLATVLWLGWNGGPVGSHLSGWLADGLGSAASVLPLILMGVGGLLLVRSALIDVRPFRTGLVVGAFGLMIALGKEHGGLVGTLVGGGLATIVGETGTVIVGVTLFIAGALLVSGASAGALLRRSGSAVRRAGSAARRTLETLEPRPQAHEAPVAATPARLRSVRPVDGAEDFPDIVGTGVTSAEAPPLFGHELDDGPTEEDADAPFDTAPTRGEYRLPDRALLKTSPPARDDAAAVSVRTAEALVETLAHFGVEATIVGQIAGPRVVRYELQLAPGTKVSKVAALKDDLSYALATTEIRILAPIPGKQAVGVEVPNLAPKLVTLGDIFGDVPGSASPLSVWLGKDISGNAVWTDLARMPHLLIAGTTGSGKSGCINALLTSILLRSTPDEVR